MFSPETYGAIQKWVKKLIGVTGMKVGTVTNGDSFPTVRPSGNPLVADDYVVPAASSTFPFSIGAVTFTNENDKAFWTGSTWTIAAGMAVESNEVAVKNKTQESLSGTSNYQNQVNIENVTELKKVIQSISLDGANKQMKFTKYDGTSFTFDLADSAGQNNLYPVMSKVVWQQILDSADCVFELDTTDSTKDKIHIKLVNNNDDVVYEARIDLADLFVLQNKTQELKNKTIDADDNTIKDITGTNFKAQSETDNGKTWIWDFTNNTWKLDFAGKIDSVDVKSGETVIAVDNTDTKNPKLESKISATQGTGVTVSKETDGLKVEVQDADTTKKGIVQLSSTPSASEEAKGITPKGANVTVTKQATPETGYGATYVVAQGGVDITEKINIPKVEVDDITIEENTDEKLQVKDEGITTAKVKDKNITNDKLEDGTSSTGITVSKINTTAVTSTISDTSTANELATGKGVYDFCKDMGWQVDYEVVDSEKFQYKFYLKDKAGVKVTGSESTVFDLPLELLKVSKLEYDNTNEKFILTYVDATGTEKTVELPASGILKGVVTETATQTITNKTIDVDDNTVSNIEVDNLKASAVSTSIPSSGAVDTKLATEKAVNDFGKVDNTTIERDTTNGMQIKDNGVSSAKIVDGAVTKAKIDTDAKVVYEEDAQTIINKSIDLDNNTITNIETDNFKSGVIETTDISNDVTKIPCSDIVKIKLGDKLNLSGGTMTGAIAMGSNKITGLATPTDDNDAVNKSYVSTNCQSKISAGTGDPSGGNDGDVYIKYTA